MTIEAAQQERKDFRLSREVWPIRFDLRIELDLEAWAAKGEATVRLRLLRPARAITLHAVDLAIGRAAVAGAAATVSYDTVAQTATLTLPTELGPGEHTLELTWTGPIAERLRGLYRSTRPGERYAATQFEVTDARRAFPCFDEPEYKAVYALTLIHPAKNAAIANAPAEHTEQLADGRTLTRFRPTEKISSYLVAFSVGPYEATPEARTRTGVPVRVWLPPGLAEKGLYARDAHVKAVQWLEDYTGIPYPYGKIDAIGVPDFEAGAMENPGAITYRTTYLAADASVATTAVLKAVFSVSAHELTHMWWGDLVTMAWWNDLWLNESFASFIGEKATAALNPEWDYDRDFVNDNERAFGLDGLATTHAISTTARNAEEAAERFDAISYTKGQAVLRMLESYVGAAAFQRGVRIYLARHREANATADDFWHAIDEAAAQGAAGGPRAITAIANSWIKEPGFPLLRCAAREEDGGLTVTFTQERYYTDPDLAPGAQRWSVPLVVRYGTAAGVTEERALLTGDSLTLRLAGARWYFPNGGGAGFYRTLLDDLSVARLAQGIAGLSVIERLKLLNDQWALTVGRRAGVDAYLRLVAAFRGETDRTILSSIAGSLGWIASHALDDALRPRFERLVDGIFRPRLAALGWDVRAGESSDDRELRSFAISALGRLARARDVIEEARGRIEAHLDGAAIAPDALSALVPVAAEHGDESLWERYDRRRREVATTDTQEEARFRTALPDFRGERLVARSIGAIFSDAIRTQDRAIMLGRLFSNREARPAAWLAIQKHWDEYVTVMEPGLKQNVMAAISQLSSPDLAREAIAWLGRKATPDMREMSAQTMERLRVLSAAAATVRADLARALDAIGA
ncbi:MAG: hypothetical protein FJ034_05525 [Chloroflexi bacterium]|nr:hypothetical protein [Chloroflexota bacterium]